jgi:hypothetical protein
MGGEEIMRQTQLSHKPSRDIDFAVRKVLTNARYVAARKILFGSVLKVPVPQRLSVDVAQQRENQTRGIWRNFVDRMVAEGWPAVWKDGVLNECRVQFIRNCPPVGLVTGTVAACCKIRMLCPYCYCRGVMNLFDRLERLLWGGTDQLDAPSEFKLLEFRTWVRPKRLQAAVVSQGVKKPKAAFKMALRLQRPLIDEDRTAEWQQLPRAVGGFSQQSFDYICGDLPVLRSSGLMVLRENHPNPPDDPPGRHFIWKVHRRPTRKRLIKILARVCRFPAGWLLDAQPHEVLRLLNCIAGCRLLSTYGRLRKPHESRPR